MKKLLLGILILVLALAVIPLFNSGAWEARTSTTINATPAQIYPDLVSFEKWPDWSVWNRERDKTCKHEFPEPRTGVGAKWIWKGAEPPDGLGEGQMEMTKASEAEGIEYAIDFKGLPRMLGAVKFVPAPGGTEVIWSSSGQLDGYFFKALLAYGLLTGGIEKEYSDCLAALKTRSEARAAKSGKAVEAAGKK